MSSVTEFFARLIGLHQPWHNRVTRGLLLLLLGEGGMVLTGWAQTAWIGAMGSGDPLVTFRSAALYFGPAFWFFTVIIAAGFWSITAEPPGGLRAVVRVLAVGAVLTPALQIGIYSLLEQAWVVNLAGEYHSPIIQLTPEFIGLVGSEGRTITGLLYVAWLAKRARYSFWALACAAASILCLASWGLDVAEYASSDLPRAVAVAIQVPVPLWVQLSAVVAKLEPVFVALVLLGTWRAFQRDT